MSDSQPWLVGPLSTPLIRTTWFWLAWIDTFEWTASTSDTDSTASRSHGRARNRYGLAVSAPTGQICTVLPEKYEENGSSGKVSTWVRFPRSLNSISGSPEISSEKRVQRAHRMHRSRSSSTRSLIGIGFSKCRLGSTNRLSPGPCDIV